MKLSQIAIMALVAMLALNCRPQEELKVETGKGQYGVVSVRNGKEQWIIGPRYERLTIIPGGKYFWVKENGKWGVIDRERNTVVPLIYDDFDSNQCSGYTFFARSYNKYAVVSAGETCCFTEAIYDTAWPVVGAGEAYSDFTFVKRSGKMGLISAGCKELLQPVYDTIIWQGGDVWSDPILYSFNGKCGIINSKGEQVVALGYDSIAVSPSCSTYEGAFVVWLNDSLAFFNERGKPFTGKLTRTKHEDFDRWLGDAMIGCKSCRR